MIDADTPGMIGVLRITGMIDADTPGMIDVDIDILIAPYH
jgi:hypothetical protein